MSPFYANIGQKYFHTLILLNYKRNKFSALGELFYNLLN